MATFPEDWNAEVKTLVKKQSADPSKLNYRHISLLPFPAKVLEKGINQQLTTYLEWNYLLDSSQSRFCSNHCTETTLIAATNVIRTLLDQGEREALILLDLSAAFNTVPHHMLIARLHNIGIQAAALR